MGTLTTAYCFKGRLLKAWGKAYPVKVKQT
jgi:hypothetical protein